MPKCFNVPGSLTGFLYHIGGCKVLILRAKNHVHSVTCAFCYNPIPLHAAFCYMCILLYCESWRG